MKVFLCHQSESKPFVRELAYKLKLVGIDSWVDEAEIGPGESIIRRIGEGIQEECDALIATISPLALDSGWVKEELDLGKYAEITRDGFQLILILVEGVEPHQLPAYLAGKNHIVWSGHEPTGEADFDHPAYGRIIRQLYKADGRLTMDAAAMDMRDLLDRFLRYLYVIGGQREIFARFGDCLTDDGLNAPQLYGEIRKELSIRLRLMWFKHSASEPEEWTPVVRNGIAALNHADVAVLDWGMARENREFNRFLLKELKERLLRLASVLALDPSVKAILDRLDLQRSKSMASLYRVEHRYKKDSLQWALDAGSVAFRFGIWDGSGRRDGFLAMVEPAMPEIVKGSYFAWKGVGWPFPGDLDPEVAYLRRTPCGSPSPLRATRPRSLRPRARCHLRPRHS